MSIIDSKWVLLTTDFVLGNIDFVTPFSWRPLSTHIYSSRKARAMVNILKERGIMPGKRKGS